jgi:hypothetical protein
LPVGDEGSEIGENVDRQGRRASRNRRFPGLSHFSSPFFLHVIAGSAIIAVTALAGTRVMNRMSVEGGGAGPVALR